jgi:uncharacterized delta-60 repeat protein
MRTKHPRRSLHLNRRSRQSAALVRATAESLERRRFLSGTLDTTWGHGGVVNVPFQGSVNGSWNAIAAGRDGRLATVGTSASYGPTVMSVARYTAAGQPDPTFGTDGLENLTVGTFDNGYAVAVQADGKILVAGASSATSSTTLGSPRFTVVRLNTDGSTDTTFGTNGIVFVNLGASTGEARSIIVTPSGQIVVGGEAFLNGGTVAEFVVARLNSDGTPDPTFGGGTGTAFVSFTGGSADGYAVALDSSGRIVIDGSVKSSSNLYDIGVARLNTDGSLDSTFGSGGETVYPEGSRYDTEGALAIGPAGTIDLVADTYTNPVVVRLTAAGQGDSTFGSGGSVSVVAPTSGLAGIGALSDGSIVVAGTSGKNPMTASLSSSGSVNYQYLGTSAPGTFSTEITNAAAVDAGGAVTIAGYLYSTTDVPKYYVARLPAGGGADTTFGTAGQTVTPAIGQVMEPVRSSLLQPDGKLIIGGSASTTYSTQSFALERYNADGSVDTTFGTAGQVLANFTIGVDQLYGLALQTDGKILAVGTASYPSGSTSTGSYIAAARFNADGSLDTTFGTGGMVVAPQIGYGSTSSNYGRSVLVQPDGKILLGGGDSNHFDVVRLTATGSIDYSFGSSGVFTETSHISSFVSMALLPNGDVLAGGVSTTSPVGFQLTRVLPTGNFDSTFGTQGVVVLNMASASVGAMAVQPDGHIVLAGSGYNTADRQSEPVVVRLDPDGSADTTFNSTGIEYVTGTGLPPATSTLTSVQILSNGDILVGNGGGKVYLTELLPGGGLDTSFGIGGAVADPATSLTIGPVYLGVNVRPNGDIVVAGLGKFYTNEVASFFAAQYLAGTAPAAGSISGNVCTDYNGNGIDDAGEPGLAGATVYLDLNGDSTLDSNDPRAVTTSTGNFYFTGLNPGAYTVREILPSGYQSYYPTSANGTVQAVTVSVSSVQSVSFSLAVYSTITGNVYNDSLGNGFGTGNAGIAGWTVYLDLNGNGALDPGEPSTVTDANGNYSLSKLPAGTYGLRQVVPAGWIVTQPQYSQVFGFYTVSLGALLPTAKPFGDFQLGTATGVLFNDVNGNNVQDAGEPGLAGWTVFADINGTGIYAANDPTAVTTSTGQYTISGLSPGTINVSATAPAGWSIETVNASQRVHSGSSLTFNVGARAQAGSITGTEYEDGNADGVYGPGDTTVTGLNVFIDTNNNGIPDSGEPVATTNLYGTYTFSGLVPGTYVLRQELISGGWYQTQPAGGAARTVTVAAGQAVLSQDFGQAVVRTPPSQQFTGTTIGTAGSYNNDGNTIAKATDGSLATYFDGPTANGDWVGLDLGTTAGVITSVEYASRSGWSSRMNGGIFQASNNAAFTSGVVTLYTIGASANPSSTALTAQAVSVPGAYRYVRYLAPAGSFGDVSEVQFFGYPAPVVTVAAGQTFHIPAAVSGWAVAPYGGLNIASGATAAANSSANRNLIEIAGTGLSLAGSSGAWTGRVDVGKNDLDLVGGNLATVSNQIHQGIANGTWNGAGGITSSAAASDTLHLTAVGAIANSTTTGAVIFSTLDGLPVAAGDVLVRYTYYGDANLDGKVDGSDYSRIDAGYAADKTSPGSATGWFNGDFNYDGVVDGSDYALIDNAFNNQGAALATAAAVIAGPAAGSDLSSVDNRPAVRFVGPGAAVRDGAGAAGPAASKVSANVRFDPKGNLIARTADKNLPTFLDGPTANDNWVGLDLGAAKSIGQFSDAPRGGRAGGPAGGSFQASPAASFSSGCTPSYTTTAMPVTGSMTTVTLSSPATAWCVRHLPPTGIFGDSVETAFFA